MTVLSLAAAVAFLPIGFGENPAHGAVAPEASEELARSLDRWEMSRARELLGRLQEKEDPQVAWAGVLVDFYSGNYRGAVKRLDSLSSPGGRSTAHSALPRLMRDTLEMSRTLTRYEGEHFVLFVEDRKDWVLVQPALETLEKAYTTLGDWLGYFPKEKVRVELIPSADYFEKVSSLSKRDITNSGAIGVCKFNKIMLLSPRLLLRGYRWRDSLAHEYLHYLMVHLTANRAPIWLQEGVARYGESLWRSENSLFPDRKDMSLLARAVRNDELVSFESMDPSLVKLPGMEKVQLAFAECALAVEYILENWGNGGLKKFLSTIAGFERYEGMDAALKGAFGVGLEEFEKQWLQYVEGKEYSEVEGLIVPVMKLAGGGDGDEWDLEAWQPLAAQNHVKLGDMLRSRKRLKPALMEYERALAEAPFSPFVLNRAGQVLLEMSKYGEAAMKLQEAIDVYPGYADSYARLSQALRAEGDLEGARAALGEAIDINPFNPHVWKGLGAVLMEMGRNVEGFEAWETAARLNPMDRDLKGIMGR